MAPAHLPQGIAEPLGQGGGAQGKTCKKGHNATHKKRRKKPNSNLCEHQGLKRGRGNSRCQSGNSSASTEKIIVVQKTTLQLMGGSCARAGGYFLKEMQPLESLHWSRFSWKPMETTHAGALHEGLHSMGRTHTGAGQTCEEEGESERSCYRLTTATILQPLLSA